METSSVRPFKTAKGPLHGSVVSLCTDSVLRGWDPKVPVGSPVSFSKRSNPAWRPVAPSSPRRINTKSKHQTSSVEPSAKGPLHGSVVSPCEDSVLRVWDPKVLLVRPFPFPSALIQRGDSWPPLPRVELIQKVSTKHGR